MPLLLRQLADVYPDTGYPRDGLHFVVMSGEVHVGVIWWAVEVNPGRWRCDLGFGL
jgi:hypothetical protein